MGMVGSGFQNAPWRLFIVLTALCLWAFHSWYTFRLFENVRFFSHLSDFEREMTYRTEMGFYFSFYKTLVQSATLSAGMDQLMADNVTESGRTINALQRFNLYPELILSAAFRLFKSLSKHFNLVDQVCWRVNRGDDMGPVESCEGVGNMHYFYVYAVFLLAGTVPCSLFIGALSLSRSYLGGLLAVIAFMFNHGEATRVQWTPPLRESFAYPVFLAQMLLVGHVLRLGRIPLAHSAWIVLLTTTFCAFWQLSQFVLGTQLGSLVLLLSLDLISPSLLLSLWALFSISFCLAAVLLFGNPLLLNSLFLSSLLSIPALLAIRRLLLQRRIHFRPAFILFHLAFHAFATVGAKLVFQQIFGLKDDNNVADLLKAKLLPNFATFHTRLYTCAPEFDFLPFETIQKLTQTWLLPASALALCLWLCSIGRAGGGGWIWREPHNQRRKKGTETEEEAAKRPCPELAYHFALLLCFLLMALLVMRLKLFATPQLCLLCSILANPALLTSTLGRPLGIFRPLLIAILLAGMAHRGVKNVQEQMGMQGEFNNPEQERLFLWIQQNTPSDAVFGGTMALMANLKLSTARPIFNHPHYENEEIRNRTLLAYSMYSRRPLDEVHAALHTAGIHFFVFQPPQCVEAHPRAECSYLAMWDLEDPGNSNRPSLCHRIWKGLQSAEKAATLLGPFRPVYESPSYAVLAL